MQDLVFSVLSELRQEILGLIGGALFFGSWMFQAWESRRAGQPVVSMNFFLMRAVACVLLGYEGLRSGSMSIFLVMLATMVLMLYNASLILRGRKSTTPEKPG